jgi:hypothetical protein
MAGAVVNDRGVRGPSAGATSGQQRIGQFGESGLISGFWEDCDGR